MRTAIILVGNIRTWDQTKSSFIETFGHLNPDIFISTYNLQYGYHPVVMSRINDFNDVVLSNTDIEKLLYGFNVKSLSINDYNYESPQVHNYFKFLNANYYDQYLTFNKGIYNMIDYEIKNNFKYDIVIKTRFDMVYNPINFINLHDSIIIDSGNVFPNDCILITNRDSMVKISDFMVNEFLDPRFTYNSSDAIPHKVLHNAILYNDLMIVQQDIMDYVMRKNMKKHYYRGEGCY